MRIGGLTAVLLAGIALAAVFGPSTGAADAPATADPLVTCGGSLPFRLSVLKGPRVAERGHGASSVILRRVLRDFRGNEPEDLPQRRWVRLGRARYGKYSMIEFAAGPMKKFSTVLLERRDGRKWKYSSSSHGGTCAPRVIAPNGIAATQWIIDAASAPLNPSATQLSILTIEQECNSGEPADGRVSVPMRQLDAGTIGLLTTITPRSGPATCPSNPPTALTFDLGEPVGTRALVDIGSVPPRTILTVDQLNEIRAGADPRDVLTLHPSNAEFCRFIKRLDMSLIWSLAKSQKDFSRILKRSEQCR